MKSMKAKTKAKKKLLSTKVIPVIPVIPEIPDVAELSQPVDTSLSNLYRVSKVLENGSDEIKSILAYECDLIYECRICRSLFRSLVNFISHKRTYCTDKFDVTFARNSSNDCNTASTNKSNNDKPDKLLQEISANAETSKNQTIKEEQKKDLTAVVNMLQKKQAENLQTNTEVIYLETMQSNSSAVYQTVKPVPSNDDCTDLMKTQIKELKNMVTGQTAVLDSNGHLLRFTEKSDNSNITNISNEEGIGRLEKDLIEENNVVCSICSARFSTKKTLAVHKRTLHTCNRLCYPCPYCTTTFANNWSVYRHLIKVHRKSNEEVRNLRSQIQEKAFVRDTTVAEDLQKEDANKLLTNGALRMNETQEWIDCLESDTELQRCGGCGKRFDRKAALSAHSQYCHRRVAAYESTTKVKKISKVSLEPVPKENIITVEAEENNPSTETSPTTSDTNNTKETTIRVDSVASLNKPDVVELLDNGEATPRGENHEKGATTVPNGIQEVAEKEIVSSASDTSDPLEIVYTNISKPKSNGSKKRRNKDSPKKLHNSTTSTTTGISGNNTEHHTEVKKTDDALLMEKQVATIVNFQKLQCLSCKRKFMSVANLRRHAAIHIGWNRYQCKLCDFKCFDKCDCVAHCNKMHSAQNNRSLIEEMIAPISIDQYIRNQDSVSNVTSEKETSTPEVIIEEHVQSEVQVEETTENKSNPDTTDTNPTVSQETTHGNGETQEGSNGDPSGLDPDLRKMVMEVIFGSPEENAEKQAETEETASSESPSTTLQNQKDNERKSKSPDLKESDNTSSYDNLKPQRPIRNKIKPLKKDFIYDLKDVTLRKEPLVVKPFNKSFNKKSLMQVEDNLERDSEPATKRFKSIHSTEISILCENNVIDKCDIKLERDIKNSLALSQCQS